MQSYSQQMSQATTRCHGAWLASVPKSLCFSTWRKAETKCSAPGPWQMWF